MTAPHTPATITRTQDEIVARIQSRPRGLLAFDVELLCGYLDLEHGRLFLKDPDGTSEDDWNATRDDPAQVLTDAATYLDFAFGKALDHRGISACRSVQKLTEWAWLMGHDDLAERMARDENYPQYGVPALQMFALSLIHI